MTNLGWINSDYMTVGGFMFIRYTAPDGETKELQMMEASITIGRSKDADIPLSDG